MKISNKLINSITLLSLSFIFSTAMYASEVGVIVASSNIKINELSKKDLEKIFLGKTTFLKDGTHVSIAYSTQNSEKMNYFFDEYIEQNQRRYKKYWLKKVFAGYGVAPRIFKSNKQAIQYIKQKESVIAFITIDEENPPKEFLFISIDGKKYF